MAYITYRDLFLFVTMLIALHAYLNDRNNKLKYNLEELKFFF